MNAQQAPRSIVCYRPRRELGQQIRPWILAQLADQWREAREEEPEIDRWIGALFLGPLGCITDLVRHLMRARRARDLVVVLSLGGTSVFTLQGGQLVGPTLSLPNVRLH